MYRLLRDPVQMEKKPCVSSKIEPFFDANIKWYLLHCHNIDWNPTPCQQGYEIIEWLTKGSSNEIFAHVSRIMLVVQEFIPSRPCVTKTCDIKWRLLLIQKALREISQCICKALFLSDNVLLMTFPKLQGSTAIIYDLIDYPLG
jgi:hypothetical protein